MCKSQTWDTGTYISVNIVLQIRKADIVRQRLADVGSEVSRTSFLFLFIRGTKNVSFEISPIELFVHTFDWWPHDPLITINYQLIKGAYLRNGSRILSETI